MKSEHVAARDLGEVRPMLAEGVLIEHNSFSAEPGLQQLRHEALQLAADIELRIAELAQDRKQNCRLQLAGAAVCQNALPDGLDLAMSLSEVTLHLVTDELKGVREHHQVPFEQTLSRLLPASLLDDQLDQLRSRIGTAVEKAEHIVDHSDAGGRRWLARSAGPCWQKKSVSSFGLRRRSANMGYLYAIQHNMLHVARMRKRRTANALER